MNLQEAISELEKGYRTFKAFEMMLDIAKQIQSSQKDHKSMEIQVNQTKRELETLQADRQLVKDEIKEAKEKAKSVIDKAIIEAKEKADKLTDAANDELADILQKKNEARNDIIEINSQLNDVVDKKFKAQKELDEINNQISILKGNLKRLVGE